MWISFLRCDYNNPEKYAAYEDTSTYAISPRVHAGRMFATARWTLLQQQRMPDDHKCPVKVALMWSNEHVKDKKSDKDTTQDCRVS